MGSNKSTLDYYDYETGKYTRNIYAERNPGVVKELGDVGNDLQIYGERLYAVINVSHLIEVMDVRTAKHIGKISIPTAATSPSRMASPTSAPTLAPSRSTPMPVWATSPRSIPLPSKS